MSEQDKKLRLLFEMVQMAQHTGETGTLMGLLSMRYVQQLLAVQTTALKALAGHLLPEHSDLAIGQELLEGLQKALEPNEKIEELLKELETIAA